MTKLLIIYHSRTGNTEAMAKAVYEGATSAGATVSLKQAADTTNDDFLSCDAVIIGTPTNFGQLAGVLKEFFDQAWLTIGDEATSKPYATFTSAASGEKNALDNIDGILDAFNRRKQLHFKKVCEGVVAAGEPSPEVLEECKALGKKLANL